MIEKFNKDGHELRAMEIDGEPWFVASDACKALGISDVSMALTRLNGDDTNSTGVISPYGSSGATRTQQVKIVNESGRLKAMN